MDSEEGFNIGEGMRKNLRVEKTVRRFVCGGFFLTCWYNDQFSLHTCCSRSPFLVNAS